MQKLTLALGSRTFWTAVLLVLVATIPQVKAFIPQPWFDLLATALGVLVAYFKVNPSQTYQ